ncbi:MAG TPA: Mpo1-like protein [Gemmatimonadaceae bacterium]
MNNSAAATLDDADKSPSFLEELRQQRWDDHRYYHQSRINQSLHLLSACTFLASYALMPFRPALAAILGWIVAMWVRQIGHFFFEPRGYDHVNGATFEHKEDIKLGYNLRRKVILLAIWFALPITLWFQPSLFGLAAPWTDVSSYFDHVGVAWIALGFGGIIGRSAWLCVTHGVQTGLVWGTKILTDPFNDIQFYWRAPIKLLQGELIDPMTHVREQH